MYVPRCVRLALVLLRQQAENIDAERSFTTRLILARASASCKRSGITRGSRQRGAPKRCNRRRCAYRLRCGLASDNNSQLFVVNFEHSNRSALRSSRSGSSKLSEYLKEVAMLEGRLGMRSWNPSESGAVRSFGTASERSKACCMTYSTSQNILDCSNAITMKICDVPNAQHHFLGILPITMRIR